jgi:hypothetical protein
MPELEVRPTAAPRGAGAAAPTTVENVVHLRIGPGGIYPGRVDMRGKDLDKNSPQATFDGLLKALEAAKGWASGPLLARKELKRNDKDSDIWEILVPHSPPSGWTRFKAGLGDVPLFKRLESVDAARKELDHSLQLDRIESYFTPIGPDVQLQHILRYGVLSAIEQHLGPVGQSLAKWQFTDSMPVTQRNLLQVLRRAQSVEEFARRMTFG